MTVRLFNSRMTCYLAAAIMAIPALAWEGDVTIETPNTQMVVHATEGSDLRMAYYGSRLTSPATAASASPGFAASGSPGFAASGSPAGILTQLRDAGDDLNFPCLPAFGTVDMIHLPALQVQHADGDLNLELRVTNYELQAGERADVHVFTLEDKKQPVTVKLFYKAYKNVDIIETWTEIVNGEKKAITLKRFDSGHLTVRRADVWLTHLHGDWAAEAAPTQELLTPGLKVIRNTDGARNAHCDAPELMISLDGAPAEEHGRTIGAALCWSGNYELRINTNNKKEHHIYCGIDPQSSEYVLDPKESFETPHLALAYSEAGMGGVSRTFHRWARTEGMLHRGMNQGDILLNSWEGLYFDINEERMVGMMDDIAQLGGELFVMDDGWFGDKYPRNDDSSSLGDWMVDTRKLPGGLKTLTDAARERGIKFGIWVEPEAVNTKSELFERHPEWALQAKGRELKLGRGGTQLVLDMTNPKVQDFAFNLIDTLLSGGLTPNGLTPSPSPKERGVDTFEDGRIAAHNGNHAPLLLEESSVPTGRAGRGVGGEAPISYIKWDANASIQNFGSTYLPQHKQQNLYIDYHRGLVSVMQRIRKKYPDVVIQDCASGGGRANYGLLPYFDEFWVSDNTDALQRVYIQWGTSLFFPANAMACHINHCPYWNTGGRVIPIKFRCDVAMSGRLGIELQPSQMTDEERSQCTTCFADYKALRPVVQTGDLYRLISPYDRKGVAALMYVGVDKLTSKQVDKLTPSSANSSTKQLNNSSTKSVLFIYKTDNYYNQPTPRIRLAGLDPDRTYTITERNIRVGKEPCRLHGKQFTGRFLMDVGVEVELWEDYASRIFSLE